MAQSLGHDGDDNGCWNYTTEESKRVGMAHLEEGLSYQTMELGL